MMNQDQVICSCGYELPRPVPRVCPNCQCTIERVVKTRSGVWLPVLLVIVMFGVLLGLILFLGNYLS